MKIALKDTSYWAGNYWRTVPRSRGWYWVSLPSWKQPRLLWFNGRTVKRNSVAAMRTRSSLWLGPINRPPKPDHPKGAMRAIHHSNDVAWGRARKLIGMMV